MKIVTFGDSFTYGEELADRSSAWGQQLANLMGVDCLNLGEPGVSNDRIVSNILTHFTSSDFDAADIIAIGWTSPGRVEYADEQGSFCLWPGCNAAKYDRANPWRGELAKYQDQYHNTKWLTQRYVQQVALIQGFLAHQGVRYVMCDTVKNEYYKNLYLVPAHTPADLVDPTYFVGWRDSGMAEWVGGVDRGPRGHFLEEGHTRVAAYLHKFIKEQRWQQ